VKVHGNAQGVPPQGKVNCLGPAGARVEQLLARALQEVSGGLLGNAILEVGVYPTKGKLLSRVMACLSEGVAVKASIVTVVMEFFHLMFGCVLFESKLAPSVYLLA
jgi:hypothetical protein